MKIASISGYSYPKIQPTKSKQSKNVHKNVTPEVNEVNFKGKKWAALQGLAWSGMGFVVAGPVGAAVGALIGAGVGSTMDDDEGGIDDSLRPYGS